MGSCQSLRERALPFSERKAEFNINVSLRFDIDRTLEVQNVSVHPDDSFLLLCGTAIKEQRDDWILTGIEVKEETENDLIRFRPKWAYIKKAPIKDKAGTEAKLNISVVDLKAPIAPELRKLRAEAKSLISGRGFTVVFCAAGIQQDGGVHAPKETLYLNTACPT
mmetsp:Transcript_23726/g.33172  ORF Transcript_23726/g.33172 Transcript_23726/m.33172 type:complete len:165 (+) Transcript_23726:66-560(+)